MSKKDDTIKALKKKIRKLKAELDTLKAGGKKTGGKKAEAKAKPKKAKAAAKPKAKSKKKSAEKTSKPEKAPAPIKLVAGEPAPPPARAAG